MDLHRTLLEAQTRFGAHLRHIGDVCKAKSTIRSALNRSGAFLGHADLCVLDAHRHLALIFIDLRRFRASRRLLDQIVKQLSSGAPTMLQLEVLEDLAFCLYGMKRLSQAEKLLDKILAARTRLVGETHISVTRSQVILACIYRDQDKFPEAEAAAKLALETKEQELGQQNIDCAPVLFCLAGICTDMDRLAEAEPLWRRALLIRERTLGPSHPLTLLVEQALAMVLAVRGQLIEAQNRLGHCLTEYVGIVGWDDPKTIEIEHGLVAVYRLRGEHQVAKIFLEQIYYSLLRVRGPQDPETIRAGQEWYKILNQKLDSANPKPKVT